MGPQDNNDDGSHDEQQQSERNEGGHTGEGAASAMAHIVNQDKRHRFQPGDPDNSSGVDRS